MYEQTLGMIMHWPLGYAPEGFALCQGQLLQIKQYQALYSILGITYGGDGKTTFGLPDLRGRITLGAGTNVSQNATYQVGAKGGEETVKLALTNLPPHTHDATPITGTKTVPAGGTLTVSGAPAPTPTPSASNPTFAAGATNGTDPLGNQATVWNYIPAADGNMVTLGSALQVSVNNPTNMITLGQNGGTDGHPNMQPFLVMNFIICISGNYPNFN